MAKKSIDKKMSERITLFRVLSDENRYAAISLLMRTKVGETVGDIAKALDMSHSSVSHLLAVLHDVGIVIYKKKGREVCYMIAKTPQAKRVVHLLQTV